MQPDADLPLFAWSPSPPTEPSPTPEKFRRAKGDPRDFRAEWDAWKAANPESWALIQGYATARADLGARRISVNALFEKVREVHAVSVNHDWRASCADDLIAMEPRLDALIERRARKVTR